MKRGKLWKFYLAFSLLFLASSLLYSESNETLEIPELEPTEEYIMTGQDLMTLYQTINDLNETKTEYKNLTNEMMGTLNDAKTLAQEYEKENRKLTLQNNFLIGGITVSAGLCVVSTVLLIVTNIK